MSDPEGHRPETLFEGSWLRLQRVGRWEYAERVRGSGGAAIVAVTPEREMLFVEQYRIPVAARTIELPAGIVGDDDGADGESAEAAAMRELEEETGWRPSRVRMLMSGPTAPGMVSESTHLVLATGLVKTGSGGGVGAEDITTHAVPLRAAGDWLAECARRGLLVEPKLYGGLYFAQQVPDAELVP